MIFSLIATLGLAHIAHVSDEPFVECVKLEETGFDYKIYTLNPPDAPKPIGPYSVAKVFDGVGYISGQIPIDPATNTVLNSTIEEETALVLRNIGNILKAMNSNYSHILKVSIFLTNMDDFPKVNEVYGSFFGENPPARWCIEVAKLPKGCRVEIDATVAVGSRMSG